MEITVRARHGKLPVRPGPLHRVAGHRDTPGSLYTARVLTEAMGGTILTRDHPERGTSITLWLRAA